MQKTPASLLDRLRASSDPEAWARFVDLYTPLLFCWARQLGAREGDAADLVQDVFVLLLTKLPAFTYDRNQRFRGWLWTVTRNRWATWKRQEPPAGKAVAVEPACVGDVAEMEEAEYRQYLVGRALQLMQADFQTTTWQAFWQCTVSERPAAEVAAELGLSVPAVYAACSRVLRRLRRDLLGLLG